jgi:short-subunit dehydrogenase involved in D-alanine esterification of teichoic acids
MQLNNRTVLITGGPGGIGLSLAGAFHSAGSRVFVCGRDPAKLQRALSSRDDSAKPSRKERVVRTSTS